MGNAEAVETIFLFKNGVELKENFGIHLKLDYFYKCVWK